MSIVDKHIIDALYEGFPDPVVVVDAQRVIVSVNPATLKQFGYTIDELARAPARILYASDEDYDLCLHRDVSLLSDENRVDGVYRYRRKDGHVFSARLRVSGFAGADGSSGGFIGVIHDVSEFLELDQERRHASNILATALRAIPEGLAIFDKDERLILFNEAYREVCGPIGKDLTVGMTAESILRAALQSGNYPSAPPGSANAEAWIDERMHDFRHPDGSNPVFPYGDGRWLRVEQQRTFDGSTVALRVDVTDLKKAEQALERQRLDYYTLVQNIPDFISRISVDMRFTFVNDHFADFLGTPASEIAGKPLSAFAPAEEQEPLRKALQELTQDAPMASREQNIRRTSGEDIWIFWSNIAIFEHGHLVEYVTVGRDITALKRQETRIARQTLELQRKNDALSQFTGTVSHDLKAPLRHLAMFSDMIAEDIAAGNLADIPVYAGHLSNSARRMDRLISSLLEYAQITDQITRWQDVAMPEVISDALLNLQSFVHESDAQIIIGDIPKVRGDPELLKRLCQNVIGNAIKYRRADVAPVIQVYAEQETSANVRIFFQDNGIGIDPRFAQKIFDVFQRLHRDEALYPGTGIGLALTKRIVESHSGSIALDSSFTQGARFIVTLPACGD